jgi:hypothetical protein
MDESQLSTVGYRAGETVGSARIFTQPEAMLPPVLVDDRTTPRLAIQVESVADFLFANGLSVADVEINGHPSSTLRYARVAQGERVEFWIVERHGTRDFESEQAGVENVAKVWHHAEQFRLRKRRFAESEEGFAAALALIDAAIGDLGVDRTCDLFFAAEREYWQSRNRAARLQKARQDQLGLGWANHDHHTYRSSREYFARLIEVLTTLGFECRERFYAGREAGWGAQVLEQRNCGLVVFADVDLSPEEVAIDFAHEPLRPANQLGTVGLWCRLHGEAFLEAGLHHLECQFDFHAAREQLAAAGVGSMDPFTNFEFLKQSFTAADNWPVEPGRIDRLLREGLITAEQAETFRREGARGSHLEILQRDEGYKGFNQTGISEIITRTDPRNR